SWHMPKLPRQGTVLRAGWDGPKPTSASYLSSSGRLEDASAEYRRAIALGRPASVAYHLGLAAVLAELRQGQSAAAEDRRAIGLNPKDRFAHAHFARFLEGEERLAEALSEYRQAVELGDKQAWASLRACERLYALRPRLGTPPRN